MIITGNRKRKLDKQIKALIAGTKIIVGISFKDEIKDALIKAGFTDALAAGESVLPSADFGPICKYNAEGKLIIHKDQPMETAYRQVEWHWEQWAGRWGTDRQSKIVDVPYQRYPRTLVSPPAISLSIVKNSMGKKYIVTKSIELDFENPDLLIHNINIFLEIFGYCEVLTDNLDDFIGKNLRLLNWKILPLGKWPWNKLKKEVTPILKKTSKQNQVVIEYRLENITSYNPEFVAIGQAGFSGYLIFGFPQQNIYALESVYSGNATYIFEENWEELSKLTKAEILEGKLQKKRIIHREHWASYIRELLS